MEVLKMQQEAETRLKLLQNMGMWEGVGRFWREGQVCFSKTAVISLFAKEELVGVNFTFEESEKLRMIKETFEANTGALVYYGIYTKSTGGNMLSLLYVSTEETEWETERNALKQGNPMVYCYNLGMGLGEIRSIRTKMGRGALIKVQ